MLRGTSKQVGDHLSGTPSGAWQAGRPRDLCSNRELSGRHSRGSLSVTQQACGVRNEILLWAQRSYLCPWSRL